MSLYVQSFAAIEALREWEKIIGDYEEEFKDFFFEYQVDDILGCTWSAEKIHVKFLIGPQHIVIDFPMEKWFEFMDDVTTI